MIKANSAIINPAVLTELIPPIVAAAVRICGRESPAAIGFLTKGHPYYITMHMKKIILPATLTPPGLPVYMLRMLMGQILAIKLEYTKTLLNFETP